MTVEMRNCQECGCPIIRGKHEAIHRWRSRRFCSQKCYGQEVRRRDRVADEQFKPRYRSIKVDGRGCLEHRWVMQQIIGRPLRADEQVHHRDHNRLNNAPENLELVTSAEHGLRHTWRPIVKTCVICESQFVPHKTKRARQQTCSRPCLRALLSLRARQRHGKAA